LKKVGFTATGKGGKLSLSYVELVQKKGKRRSTYRIIWDRKFTLISWGKKHTLQVANKKEKGVAL